MLQCFKISKTSVSIIVKQLIFTNLAQEFIDRQQLQFCQLHPNAPHTSAQENGGRDCLLLLRSVLSFQVNILKVISNDLLPGAFSFKKRWMADTRSPEVSTENYGLEKLKRRQKGLPAWYKLLLPFTACNPSWLFGLMTFFITLFFSL